jgi:Rrf2 family protein
VKVSTKGRYALRVMIDLALHNTGEFISLKEIAHRQNITIKYLEQIIGMLQKAGYVLSLRGQQGGYRLAKAPEETVVGDILRLAEGSLSPLDCLEQDSCAAIPHCPTRPFWAGLYQVITRYVDQFTIADLAEEDRQRMELDYSI